VAKSFNLSNNKIFNRGSFLKHFSFLQYSFTLSQFNLQSAALSCTHSSWPATKTYGYVQCKQYRQLKRMFYVYSSTSVHAVTSTHPEAFHRYLTDKEISLWDSEQSPEGRCRNKWAVMVCSTQSQRKDKNCQKRTAIHSYILLTGKILK